MDAVVEKERREALIHDCVIVGGGLAGLSAAQEMKRRGLLDVVVLEADVRVGGRVKRVDGILPWPVEAGAQFLHGAHNSIAKDVLQAAGCSFREYEWPDRYYFGKENRWIRREEAHPEVEEVHRLFQSVSKQRFERDMSAEEWLKEEGASRNVVELARSCYANDFACSLHHLGMLEVQQEALSWIYGDEYLVASRPLSVLVDCLRQGLDVRTGHQVCSITGNSTMEESEMILKCNNHAIFRCKSAVITVPVTVLQAGDIMFDPPLPQRKLHALSRLKMSNALKVVMGFRRSFWPADMFDAVCTDCFLPEIWMLDNEQSDIPPDSSIRTSVVGFVAGDEANAISRMTKEDVLAMSLQQLDTMFGTTQCPSPATSSFVLGSILDWSKEKYVRGAYTFPCLGARGARDVLAEPVGHHLFFAGEATHPGANPCIQAAMETGIRAAKQVLGSVRPFQSKI